MPARSRSFKVFKTSSLVLLGGFCLLLVYFAQGPDQDLHFLREVPSRLVPSHLDRNVSSLNRWPQWFFAMKQARVVSPTKDGLGSDLKKGALIALEIERKKGRKRFELTTEVTEYTPGRSLSLKMIDDSSGRLTRLFDEVSWTIEIEPTQNGSLIRGKAKAHTQNWRSRLFGRLSEKILMNQLFYADLLKLSELKQPFSVDSADQLIVPSGSI